MRNSTPRINRRNFIAVSAVASLPTSVTATSKTQLDVFTSEKVSKKVIIRQTLFQGRHPVMDNPYLRNQAQVDMLVERARKLNVAHNIKLMALAHFLKQPISASE